MENEYIELLKVADLLTTVEVGGKYWAIMEACRNSVLKVAKAIKEVGADEIDNEHKS